ncbi:MAG: LPS-assembly protein LptD [Paracoccaceae bacterium]
MTGGLMRLLLVALALAAGPLRAQQGDPAFLVADRVFLEGSDRLVAEGEVEALQGDTRLQARRVIYDAEAGTLTLDGPLRVTEGDGTTVILAESAELDRDLQTGLIRGARLVLDRQLQLAATRIDRVQGRYALLTNTAVTSCQVCNAEQAPLWQIRARRVIHDREARQLYFDGAQLRVLDVPVFYLPRLRLPDPTLQRAQGFLLPSIRSTTRLGTGLKLPYFVPLGPHRDITLTPYLSRVTRTAEFRYRQAFARGDLQVDGALTRDSLRAGRTRGYFFAEGAYALGRGFRLGFDLEITSDAAYLKEYDYSDKDRLNSELTLSRTRSDSHFAAGLAHYHSLRESERNGVIPTIVADIAYERRLAPRGLGGLATLRLEGHSHFRYSTADITGRDLGRLSAELDWARRWTLAGGLRAGLATGLALDAFAVAQDSGSDRRPTAATPRAALELRWPMARRTATGATDLLEPVAMLGWAGGTRPRLRNDESTRAEFDGGNLLSLSRFPAADRRERGGQAALGLRWMRHHPTGWSAGLTLGRVYRDSSEDAFTRSSGLDGAESDWLLAGRFDLARGLSLNARGLIADDGALSKAEARAIWREDRIDLSTSYLLLARDAAEDRPDALSEWSFDGSYRLSRHWTGSAEWRYDLAADRAAKAGLGLQYRNECVEVTLSASRSYTSSANLEPTTDFGLTVALKGFSTGGSAREYRRTCN